MLPFYALILAHLIADFVQPAALVRWTKQGRGGLLVHVGLYSVLTAFVLAGYGPYWGIYLAILAISHLVLDHSKQVLSTKFSSDGLLLFIADQVLHVVVIALVAFAGGLGRERSPFLALISAYSMLLPIVTWYVAGTFAVSIFVFEAGRTLAPQPGNHSNDEVATGGYRFVGMLERAAGMTLIIARLYVLVPLAFAVSAYRLFRSWKTADGRRLRVEMAASVLGAVAIGVIALLYGTIVP